jgi:hypothetical protein
VATRTAELSSAENSQSEDSAVHACHRVVDGQGVSAFPITNGRLEFGVCMPNVRTFIALLCVGANSENAVRLSCPVAQHIGANSERALAPGDAEDHEIDSAHWTDGGE